MNLDANSLYSWAMTKPLPENEFSELSEDEARKLFLEQPWSEWPGEDDEYGYILDVDLEYPPEVAARTAQYPLAPEHRKVDEWELSDEQKVEWKMAYGSMAYKNDTKLVATCHPKRNYVVHYRALQLYLELGLQLTAIHKVLKFRQRRWLKSYIEANISRRVANSGDKFKSDYYKLCNNSVFGKSFTKTCWSAKAKREYILIVSQFILQERLRSRSGSESSFC